jgi:DNA-binding CsgD family transcriptional regulator
MLVDRDFELDVADRALAEACGGTGSLVVIRGSLGMGKSELLRAFSQRARDAGFRVLRANGAVQEQDLPYGVVRQLFEFVLATASQEIRQVWEQGADNLLELWGEPAPGSAPEFPIPVNESALHGLSKLAVNMSAEQPLLLLVDCLQWTDTLSLRWLNHMSKRLATLPIAVVVTIMDGDPCSEQPLVREIGDAATATLRLGRLSLAGVRALLDDEFGEVADGAFLQECLRISEGNPLLLTAIVHDMKAAGLRPLATEVESVRSLQLSGLHERVLSCLNSQPAEVRGLVEAAAVLDQDVDDDVVARVAALDRVQYGDAVRVLRRVGLLTSQSPPGFVHPAVRSAIEESMAVSERDDIRLRAAGLLHSEGHPPDLVAPHLIEVASPLECWNRFILSAAADIELGRGLAETSARYLRRALLDSPEDGQDRARLLVGLATAERAFAPSASVRHVCQAVPMLASTRERAEAAVQLAPMTLATSPTLVTEFVREVGEELGPPENLSGTERELALRVEARQRYLTIEDPVSVMDSVRRLARWGPNPPLDTPAERELLSVLLYAATITGKVGATEVARLANAILEREPSHAGHVHTGLPLLVNVLIGADSLDLLLSWLNRVWEQGTYHQDVVARTLVCTELALLLMATGKLTQALSYAREAIQLGGLDGEHGSSVTLMTVALLAIETGDPELTEMLLNGFDGRAKTVCVVGAFRLLQGSAATERSETGPALQQILDLGRQLEQLRRPNPALCPWRGIAATLHHRLGNVDDARELIEEEYKLAMDWGAPMAIGRSLRVYASFSDKGKDVALLREAITVLQGSANRIELARTHLLLGRRIRDAGEAGAGNHLREARKISAACGVQWMVDCANADLGKPVSRTTTGSVLTPSEQRVADMVCEGLTNQEIAEKAQVTSRAVEKHLTKVYRKLGIRGRVELAGALRPLRDQPSPQ